CRDITTRLTEITTRLAGTIAAEKGTPVSTEVLTRPAEIEHVVMVAENLPTPAEIDFSWVRQRHLIIAKVLLDESFLDALNSISQETSSPDSSVSGEHIEALCDPVEHLDSFSGTATLRADGIDMSGEWRRGYRVPADEQIARVQHDLEMTAKRSRLYEH